MCSLKVLGLSLGINPMHGQAEVYSNNGGSKGAYLEEVSRHQKILLSHMTKLCCITCNTSIEPHSASLTCKTQLLLLKHLIR